ncbi:MAG: hypothetical protein ABIJ48_04395 [Actinomycetota bacterium]
MAVVWRIMSVGALALSGGILVLAILSVRKEQKVRPGLDLLRLAITMGTTALMARFLGVATAEALMGLGFLAGLLLGLYEGLRLRVRFLGGATFAHRTVLGVVIWGAGVLLVQTAGVIDRVGLADLGLSLSFVGIGQIVGLLAGRWQTVISARSARASGVAGATALVLALALPLLAPWVAEAQPAPGVDLRDAMAGAVPGVTVEVRGSGLSFFGPSLRLHVDNQTGADLVLIVPLGLQFLPEEASTQTMIAAGGETVTVPAGTRAEPYATEIMAFCGQHDDHAPTTDDVFAAGEVVTGGLAGLIRLINWRGVYGYDEQLAVWNFTDGTDVGGSAVASDLVERARATGDEEPAPVAAVDDDAGNALWDCATNPEHRAGFGDTSADRVRCFTFRYDLPEGGIESAVVYMAIEAPSGSDQGTDSVAVAVGEPFDAQCDLKGDMAGCVSVHGGFAGGERSLTLDLLDLACAPTFAGTREMQDAVRAQLESGVLHMVVQDDTALHGARLALNEGPPRLSCGTSAGAAPLGRADPDDDFTAGEGTRTSFVGLGGALLLLVSGLAEGGNSLASVAASWRGGGLRGLRDLAQGLSGGGGAVPEWRDVRLDLSGGRAGAALQGLPPGVRDRVQEILTARLDAEQTDRLVEALGQVVGPEGGADPAAALAADPKASGLLDRLPDDVRSRIEGKLLAVRQEERVQRLVEEAARGVRRGRAVGLLREAIERRDGPAAQRILSALGEGEGGPLWQEAAGGIELRPGDLEYPPPATEGPGPLPAGGVDPAIRLEAEVDLALAGSGGDGGGEAFAALPSEVREEAQRRLGARLEAEGLDRWLAKLRDAAGAAGPQPTAGSGLKGAAAQRLLESLPPGLRERVQEHAARVLDAEVVERLADQARRALVEDRAVAMLREAISLGDRDRVDAIMDAFDAAVDVVDEADLERLLRQAGGAGLMELARMAGTGPPLPPGELTAHLAGEADLLGAARRVEGVADVLGRAGAFLRPRVEQALVSGLDAERFDGAVGAVVRALSLDRAEEGLREAVRAGDIGAVDRILASLSPQDRSALEASVGGGT